MEANSQETAELKAEAKAALKAKKAAGKQPQRASKLTGSIGWKNPYTIQNPPPHRDLVAVVDADMQTAAFWDHEIYTPEDYKEDKERWGTHIPARPKNEDGRLWVLGHFFVWRPIELKHQETLIRQRRDALLCGQKYGPGAAIVEMPDSGDVTGFEVRGGLRSGQGEGQLGGDDDDDL